MLHLAGFDLYCILKRVYLNVFQVEVAQMMKREFNLKTPSSSTMKVIATMAFGRNSSKVLVYLLDKVALMLTAFMQLPIKRAEVRDMVHVVFKTYRTEIKRYIEDETYTMPDKLDDIIRDVLATLKYETILFLHTKFREVARDEIEDAFKNSKKLARIAPLLKESNVFGCARQQTGRNIPQNNYNNAAYMNNVYSSGFSLW
jgi:hypothetical protein